MENTISVNKKYLLIDLDGTLIDTADILLKPMKDGQEQTDLSKIRLFTGAREFIKDSMSLGFECIIVSDSHPIYVNPIVREYFENIPALSLADKPNTLKTSSFLHRQGINILENTCYVIGDSWLDIELGRGLRVPTILTSFYQARNIQIRDGIGDYVKNIKSGSTYYAESYSDIISILSNPLQNLLCLEAEFRGVKSFNARKPCRDLLESKKLTAHRVLARQSDGECDEYHITERYHEFNQVSRSNDLLYTFRDAVINYIDYVLAIKSYSWNIFTYVSDKRTTQPSNKVGELFDLIAEQVQPKNPTLECRKIFQWSYDVNSSTRKQPTTANRKNFVADNLMVSDVVDVNDRSLIILDDQYTTGATADVLIEKLRDKGAKNVLFIALFHLVAAVNSNRLCPNCLSNGLNKQLRLKINRQTGEKFYSCVLPQYGGDGCGYNDSGKLCPVCLNNGLNKYLKIKINRQTGEKFYSCVSPQYGGDGCGYTETLE